MLSQFIDKLKENHKVDHLFWRAEKQQNGNIHFHIITDKFIDKTALNKYWNWILEKEGYIQPYWERFGKKDPPSVHVKGFDTIDNFIDYVLKYATKEDKYGKVEGRIYGMTDSLRAIRPFVTNPDTSFEKDLQWLLWNEKNKIFKEDFATIILFDKVKLRMFGDMFFVKEYKDYLLATYDFLYTPTTYDEVNALIIDTKFADNAPQELPHQLSLFEDCPKYCPGKEVMFFDDKWW